MVRFKKGTKGAGIPIPMPSPASSYPAVSWADETEDTERIVKVGERKRAEASEDVIVCGPGNYVIGEDILPGEYAVFTEDISEHNTYSACTITLYKDNTGAWRIGTFQFQHHGLISPYEGQHLIITKGYAVETDQTGITPGTIGMYKTGRDMEPGTYRITSLTSGSEHYALYNDMRYYHDYIDECAALSEPVTVNIANGQYPELFDAGSIERMPGQTRPINHDRFFRLGARPLNYYISPSQKSPS